MKGIIQKKLEEIEKQENVKIILAIESGSRVGVLNQRIVTTM